MVELFAIAGIVFFVSSSWSVYRKAAAAIKAALPKRKDNGLSDDDLEDLHAIVELLRQKRAKK